MGGESLKAGPSPAWWQTVGWHVESHVCGLRWREGQVRRQKPLAPGQSGPSRLSQTKVYTHASGWISLRPQEESFVSIEAPLSQTSCSCFLACPDPEINLQKARVTLLSLLLGPPPPASCLSLLHCSLTDFPEPAQVTSPDREEPNPCLL